MYLAIFLTPWILTYGISLLYMNHMPFFQKLLNQKWGEYIPERELTYDRPLPADGEAAARQILQDLHMDGVHATSARRNGSRIIIDRWALVNIRRITYTAADHKLIIERQPFDVLQFLRRIHKRHGYEQPYLADTLWAASLDLVIIGMLSWGLTGLWMWFKMKRTRRWGVLCVAVGCLLFAMFLLTI